MSNQFPLAGADNLTPSYAQYFSWINNTNEGSTEKQTLINLNFFRWLHDEYGMKLDIYAFDAGNLDGPHTLGAYDTEKFKSQFPNGFDGIAKKAAEMGTRLGMWGSPDGFGDTPAEAEKRAELWISLCRDYHFMLFKFDSVASEFRLEQQDTLRNMLIECRKYSPDLIVLNHRLNLGTALPYITTDLWSGQETYIDVHMRSYACATHNRQGAMSRGLVDGCVRVLEDHGVCLSSCLDYWQDDLILQAFGRCLILSPEIYGNPWFLRDDEFWQLARIYNLHRRFRDILLYALPLPESLYGAGAVSRGDARTRLLVMKNLTWEPVVRTITLDTAIGLIQGEDINVRLLHPVERVVGSYAYGAKVEITVLPFRACLVLVSANEPSDITVSGCDYGVMCDVPGKPVQIALHTMEPGRRTITVTGLAEAPAEAKLDATEVPFDYNAHDKTLSLDIQPTRPVYTQFWHRKLGEAQPTSIPDDIRLLYETAMFAADNNALEIGCLDRSGESHIEAVIAAREAFLAQDLLRERGVWDAYALDGQKDTYFVSNERARNKRGAYLRVDLGALTAIDQLAITTDKVYPGAAQVSANLTDWTVCSPEWQDETAVITIGQHVRYILFDFTPDRLYAVTGLYQGEPICRKQWKVNNLMGGFGDYTVTHTAVCSFTLEDIYPNSYLAAALPGRHGDEGAYAVLRITDAAGTTHCVGAKTRSVSYPSNIWEFYVRRAAGQYTYYFPLEAAWEGCRAEMVFIGLDVEDAKHDTIQPEVWQTAYPIPHETVTLTLTPFL